MFGNITDVPGIKVGHRENEEGITGCTALLMEGGAVCGVDVRGSAPGTRETDALDPINEIDRVHGICLSGGSAFGLDAATGVMRFLEEQGIGVDAGVAKIPIVPSAVLFDLFIGDPQARPTAQMGYEAAQAAQVGSFQNGNIGAGYGTTVGKLAGPDFAMKGGLGSASFAGKDGLIAGAIVAVNAVGDVKHPHTRQILAG
ncbi:P1 family peptidase, partial [Lysinibacillus sphaericus]|uniref:P1 family peptidase n=1 Tax=Lysinibacillus sphaericus TaxID=1421 RepID=UPI002FBD63B1